MSPYYVTCAVCGLRQATTTASASPAQCGASTGRGVRTFSELPLIPVQTLVMTAKVFLFCNICRVWFTTGRYDCVCPAISAWDLHRAWPEARFTIVQDSGHASTEPGTTHHLIEATNEFGA